MNDTDFTTLGDPTHLAIPGDQLYRYSSGAATGSTPAYDITGFTGDPQLSLVISGLAGIYATYNGTHTLTGVTSGGSGVCRWEYTFGDGTIARVTSTVTLGWYASLQNITGVNCFVEYAKLTCDVSGSYSYNACTCFATPPTGWDCDDADDASFTVSVI